MKLMRNTRWLAAAIFSLVIFAGSNFSQSATDSSASIALVLIGNGDGVTTRIAPALAIRSDGVYLVPNHILADAKEVQIRLKNGEIFDDVVLVGSDERRDIAAIRIDGAQVNVFEPVLPESLKSGDPLTLITHSPGKLWLNTPGKMSATRLADEIPGAGQGFRVIQFQAELSAGMDGGILLSSTGVPVGFMTRDVQSPVDSAAALPLISVKNIASERRRSFGSGKALTIPTDASLNAARNPTKDPKDLILNAKTVIVDSRTTFFKTQQLINELNKRKEIKDLGWVFVESWVARSKADLIIELDHQIMTFDFTFAITHRKTSIVIAAGKAVIADGASGAPKMVDQILKSIAALTKPVPGK